MISVHDDRVVDAFGDLAAFRLLFYRCLPRRADALFELADAVLCADHAVTSLVQLSLEPELSTASAAAQAGCARRSA